jgi:hypothetical protein
VDTGRGVAVIVTVKANRRSSATKQREAARSNRHEVLHERNLLLALVAAQFPAHIAPSKFATSAKDDWKWIVCVHLPERYLVWRISDEERRTVFAALAERPDDSERHTHEEKIGTLEALVAGLQARKA